jgi:diguanylate cyclase (GGDEF)-like protein/PAS domain S-box-containing protein
MSSKAQITLGEEAAASAQAAVRRRERLVRILFVHRSPRDVERCLRELKKMRYTVSSDVVLTPKQFAERLEMDVYDTIVAEYPNPNWEATQALEIMQEMDKNILLVYLVHGVHRESAAELLLKGAADCIDMENIERLPVAVHRALGERVLREQRDRAERELRRSEARYRALVGNQSYGICRCGRDGRFLEVNEAMMRMLGYTSAEEVLTQDLARELIQDPGRRAKLLGQLSAGAPAEPVEMDWRRKDEGVLKVRLSGREVLDDRGALEAYELIAEDVTQQRELEDHLRKQAASDSLTGLANYRCLVEVLHSEIRRSKRTNRQFALLLFDVDGLKAINDRHGHMVGSQALCRLADVLLLCCRDIDTSARFGGDEFALVLPEANAAAARQVAQRICENLANDHKGPKVSVSVGVAVYPEDGETIERLLCEADSGLYARKLQRTRPADSRQSGAGTAG